MCLCRLSFALGLVFSGVCSGAEKGDKNGITIKSAQHEVTLNRAESTASAENRQVISMVALLSDPSRFHGHDVDVSGFVARGEKHTGHLVLSLNTESLRYNIGANMVYLDLSKFESSSRFRTEGVGKCCRLSGIVDASRRDLPGFEGLNMFSCTLVLRSFSVLAGPKENESKNRGNQTRPRDGD